MASSTYYRSQAATCLRIARKCPDGAMAQRFKLLAQEYLARAERFQQVNPTIPDYMIRATPPGADIDRD